MTEEQGKFATFNMWFKRITNVLMLLIVLFFAAAFFPFWSMIFYEGHTEFTEQNWQSSHELERLKMAEDFLDKTDTKNLTKTGILEMLGKPSLDSGNRFDYVLSPTIADYMMLVFSFDENDNVEKAYIYEN